jgi:hypothetical protein
MGLSASCANAGFSNLPARVITGGRRAREHLNVGYAHVGAGLAATQTISITISRDVA